MERIPFTLSKVGNQLTRFKTFQITRAMSSAGDEMWVTAFPIFLALRGYAPASVGLIFSAGAFGSLLGFLLIPAFCHRLKASTVAAVSDCVQLFLFVAVLYLLLQKAFYVSVPYWIVIQLFTSTFGSLWYGASETLMTRVSEPSNAQTAHRLNYFSSSFGPAVGPALAGALFGLFGLASIVLFNAVSFTGQAIALLRLGSEEAGAETDGQASLIRDLRSGIATVWTDLRLRYITVVAMTVKVFMLGLLPFLAFALSLAKVRPELTGIALAAFSAGSLLGAFGWLAKTDQQIVKAYSVNALILVFAALLINLDLFFGSVNLWVSILTFLSGWCIARYTIALRSMRQRIVPRSRIPIVVASQGFLARIATPISGIFYGSVLSRANVPIEIAALILFVVVSVFSIWQTVRAFEISDVV